jgi:hypothetical protein
VTRASSFASRASEYLTLHNPQKASEISRLTLNLALNKFPVRLYRLRTRATVSDAIGVTPLTRTTNIDVVFLASVNSVRHDYQPRKLYSPRVLDSCRVLSSS